MKNTSDNKYKSKALSLLRENRDNVLKYLRTARRFNDAWKDLKCTAPALRTFLSENGIIHLRCKGFFQIKNFEKKAWSEETIKIRQADMERTREYLTIEDFHKIINELDKNKGERK